MRNDTLDIRQCRIEHSRNSHEAAPTTFAIFITIKYNCLYVRSLVHAISMLCTVSMKLKKKRNKFGNEKQVPIQILYKYIHKGLITKRKCKLQDGRC